MEIESDEDSWQPQRESSLSVFEKIKIEFSDRTIEQNLDKILEVPNYYNTQINEQDYEEYEDCISNKKDPSQQAFYDPLEDDENQRWRRNTLKKNKKQMMKNISCPNCFGVVAESFEKLEEDKYIVEHPVGVIIDTTKIIRNKESEQIMKKSRQVNISKSIESLINGRIDGLYMDGFEGRRGVEDEQIGQLQQELRLREQQFNIKIVCTCNCGNELGFFDVNKQVYTFINVVQ